MTQKYIMVLGGGIFLLFLVSCGNYIDQWLPLIEKTAKELVVYDFYYSDDEIMQYEKYLEPITSQNLKLTYDILQKQSTIILTHEEYKILCDIVEAEAEGEDVLGKLLIVNVIFNRVESVDFPNTIEEVVFQKQDNIVQFSPITGNRFSNIPISEETIEAVERGLSGEDISEGALYFVARKIANKNHMSWFDNQLTYLFTHGGHEFFY